jgi:hypothetical protein
VKGRGVFLAPPLRQQARHIFFAFFFYSFRTCAQKDDVIRRWKASMEAFVC